MINTEMTGHVDSQGIGDHVLEHDHGGCGHVYSVGVVLWQTEPMELFKAFLPKSLKTIPTVPA